LTLLIGHRGAAALARENSLEAIEAAAAAGVDGVELDVFRTRDGRLVLAHGPEVPPDAPPLEAGIALARELGLFVQLDIKLRGVEADVVAALGGEDDGSFVSSFSLPTLVEFARLAPGLPRALTYPEDRLGVSGSILLRPFVGPGLAVMRAALPRRLPRWLATAQASLATLHWAVITPTLVAAVDVPVYAWTVNDAALAKTLVESGTAAIITDDPLSVPGGISST
jgi:glycerophosphoryl diester phosphodiesterase